MSTLGENIVALRRQRKLTQKALAEKLSVSATRLNYWEKDKSNPSIELLDKIAEVLEVPVDSLMPSASDEALKKWDKEIAPEIVPEEIKTLEKISKEYGKEAVTLLEAFSQLNAIGIVKALEYVSDLSEQDKYIK